jgi:arabinogalactan oligomer / maltooligosaccharide transport system permease protein
VTRSASATPARSGAGALAWLRRVGWRHAVAVLAVLFSLFPVVFVLSAALNPVGSLSSTNLVPTGAGLGNFGDLLHRTAFGHWYLNSILVAGASAAGSVFLSMLAAYAFSRMRFAGRRVGLISLLLIQVFPQFLAVVAIFLMFSSIGDYYPEIGLNTEWGLLLLLLGGALGINTWLMKGFLDTVPREIDESAVIDGASHAQTFFRITLPLVAPILAVTALISFITNINEFLLSSTFLTSPNTKTLPVGLYGLLQGERNANFGMFAAGSLLTAIPTVVLFQFLQRYIVSGLTVGAVKG